MFSEKPFKILSYISAVIKRTHSEIKHDLTYSSVSLITGSFHKVKSMHQRPLQLEYGATAVLNKKERHRDLKGDKSCIVSSPRFYPLLQLLTKSAAYFNVQQTCSQDVNTPFPLNCSIMSQRPLIERQISSTDT